VTTTLITSLPRPDVAEPALWRFPPMNSHRLPSGLGVLLYDVPGQHVADVVLELGISMQAEPKGLEGIAALMVRSLRLGTRRRGPQEFADALAGAGVVWDPQVGPTGVRLHAQVAVTRLDDALRLVAEGIVEPALGQREIGQQIQATLADQIGAAAMPALRVHRELPAALIDPDHRLARPVDGDAASLLRITPALVQAFHAAHVRPAAATLVIAADLRGIDNLLTLVEEAFGHWTGDPTARREPAPVPRREQPGVVLVDRPGALQTQMLIATFCPHRGLPESTALKVAADVLGRPVTGRINAEQRERRGATYGIRITMADWPGTGVLAVEGAVDTEASAETIADVLDVLRTARATGLGPGEIAEARQRLLHTAPLGYESAADIARQAGALVAEGHPLNLVSQYLTDLDTLPPGKVNGAFAQLDVKDPAIVLVGDASRIADDLRTRAGLGRLTVIGA
jgi:predicted Zn-dependent peptidase